MKFFDEIKSALSAVKHRRSLSGLKALMANIQSDQAPYPLNLTPTSSSFGTEEVQGMTDITLSPDYLYDLAEKEAYFSALYDTMVEALFANGFYFDIAKDENGKEIGSPALVKEFEYNLKKLDYEKKVKELVRGLYSDGGGNVLLFTTKDKDGFIHHVEPFIREGKYRVKVKGNSKLKVITQYEVIDDNDQAIYTLNPKTDFVFHERYTEGGNYKFSSNPAKRAVYYHVLKSFIAGANHSIYKNGLQDAVLMTTDYSALKVIIEAMANNKVSGISNDDELLKNPLKFFSKLAENADEILREHMGNVRRSGEAIRIPLPVTMNRIGRTNKDMQSIDLADWCDLQIGYCLRIPPSAVNSKFAKYSNAEIESDNWQELVLRPLKLRIERITVDFFLSSTNSAYDPEIYPFRFGHDPNEEQIAVWEKQITREKSKAEIISILQSNPAYEFDIESNAIVKLEVPNKVLIDKEAANQKIQEDLKQSNEKHQEEVNKDKVNEGQQRAIPQKKKTISEAAIESSDGRKFVKIVSGAVDRQLKAYVESLKSQGTIETAIKLIDSTLQPISKFGLTVTTYSEQSSKFAKLGVADFESTEKKSNRFTFPKSISLMIDARAQLMIKGWDSLSEDQKKLLRVFSEDLKGYKGVDQETTNEINTILKNIATNYQGSAGIAKAVEKILEIAPELSQNRAQVIAETEIAQSVEGTREILYREAGYQWHSWDTVGDLRVRDSHKANKEEGVIPISQAFTSGENSPAEAIRCRCSVRYGKSKEDLTKLL